MDAKQTTMSTRLNFLLTHFLSSTTDAELSGNVNYVIADLKQGGNRVFREADAAALSRWSTKVGSLVASPQSRTSGFRLAKISLELSPALWTTAAGLGSAATNSASAKAWFDQAFRLVQKSESLKTCSPATAAAALDFLNTVFRRLPQHADFAKQTVGSNTTTRIADGLLDYCKDNANAPASANAYKVLVILLQNHGASLKSLGGKFQDIVMAEIEHPGAQEVLANIAYCHGRAESARQWKSLAEQIACQIRYYALPPLTTSLTPRTQSSLHKILNTFRSLLMPAVTLPDGSPLQPSNFAQATRYVDRLNALMNTLHLMLSASTDRAMLCPTSALLGLAIYMISLVPTEQTSKRDEAVRTFEMSLLPQIHIQGAKLAIQLVANLGSNIAEHDHEVLAAMWQAAQVYPVHSRHRACLLSAYTLYLSKALVNFEEETLEPTSHALSVHLAALKRLPLLAPKVSSTKNGTTTGQKAKSRLKLDDAQELSDTRPLNIDLDALDAAELACESLARMAALPQFPDKQFALVARLTLQLCLDPDFPLACTGPNLSASIPQHNHRLIQFLDFRPELREGLIELLLTLTSSPKAQRMPSLLNAATNVFAQASLSSENEVALLGKQGVNMLLHTLHPAVPALPVKGGLLDAELLPIPSTSETAAGLFGPTAADDSMDVDSVEAEKTDSRGSSTQKGKQRASPEAKQTISTQDAPTPAGVDVAPSASALATDFEDSISGPIPVDSTVGDIEPTKEGSPVASPTSKESANNSRRAKYSGDISMDNVLAGGQKRARTSLPEVSKKPRKSPAPHVEQPTGPLVIRPHGEHASSEKSDQSSNHSEEPPQSKRKISSAMKGKTPESRATSPVNSAGTLRVLPYKGSEKDRDGRRQEPKDKTGSQTSTRRASASPANGDDSLLTADASELPEPSASDFFRNDSPAEGTEPELGSEKTMIDPGLLEESTTKSAPTEKSGFNNDDSDSDGPMPQIVDGMDSEDEDEGEVDTEMAA